MPADRVKGITIEIGGDTTALSKSLSGVNKEISSTQKQLKDVERLLKLDPTNTELLAQKQRLLKEAVSETKDKLETLKEAEKQVQQQFKEGKVSQEQYESLKRELISVKQQVEDLESAAKDCNVALLKIGDVSGKVSEVTGSLADKTRGLSAGAAGLLGTAATAAYKAGAAADDLNTLSKQSGFSTEQIQTWQYGADRVDVSVEDIINSAKKMKKNMISTSSEVTDAWERLGVSVRDQNGELRDSTQVFDEVVLALSSVNNETERDTLAMTLFGKSADSLAGLLDDGGEAFRQFGQEAKDAGLILSQDALDSANEFNDAVDTLKAQATGTFADLGTEIATMLLPVMETFGEKAGDLLEWIRNLDPEKLKMIGKIALIVAALSPVLSLISKISGGIQTLTTVVIPGISKAVSFIISNPIALVIAAIIGLVVLIATKGDEIKAILQKIDDFLQNVFATDWTKIFGPVLGEVLNSFFANIKNIWDSAKKIFDGIIDFIRGVFTGDWERAWTGVKEIFGGIFDGLKAVAKAPLNGIISLVNTAISGINGVIKLLNKIPGVDIGEIGKIPYLAKGGVVTSGRAIVGEAGPELLTVSGGKTVVQPLTNNTTNNTSLGGLTINVYGAPGQDVNELADAIAERIEDLAQRKDAVFA